MPAGPSIWLGLIGPVPCPGRSPSLDNGKEFLRLSTLADVRDFLKHVPTERRQFSTWRHADAQRTPYNCHHLPRKVDADLLGKLLM